MRYNKRVVEGSLVIGKGLPFLFVNYNINVLLHKACHDYELCP